MITMIAQQSKKAQRHAANIDASYSCGDEADM